MSRQNVFVLVISILAVCAWVGYSIYASFFLQDYVSVDNVDPKYLAPVSTEMYLTQLQALNNKQGEIKVSRSSLMPTQPQSIQGP